MCLVTRDPKRQLLRVALASRLFGPPSRRACIEIARASGLGTLEVAPIFVRIRGTTGLFGAKYAMLAMGSHDDPRSLHIATRRS